MGLATDQQQHAYVLRAGETDAPAGIRAALRDANRLQDIHLEEMQVGRSGNEVLRSALQRAKTEGIRAQIYTHPLGYHGHAAGPLVGYGTGKMACRARANTPCSMTRSIPLS